MDADRNIYFDHLKISFFHSEEIFYQILIFDFGNFGKIEYDPPLPLQELLVLAVSQLSETELAAENNSIEEMAESFAQVATTRSDMLKEYYNLIIEDGKLYSLPLLIGRWDFRWDNNCWRNKKKFNRKTQTVTLLPTRIHSQIVNGSGLGRWGELLQNIQPGNGQILLKHCQIIVGKRMEMVGRACHLSGIEESLYATATFRHE